LANPWQILAAVGNTEEILTGGQVSWWPGGLKNTERRYLSGELVDYEK